MSSENDVRALERAARGLPIVRRAGKDRWTHLSLCLLDAVFSIGVKYTGVVRVCRRYAEHAGLAHPLLPAQEAAVLIDGAADQPLDAFVTDMSSLGPERFACEIVRNRGRTSTRNGVLKAEATLRYADMLTKNDVRLLSDVAVLLSDLDRLGRLEAELANVPGHGSGVD